MSDETITPFVRLATRVDEDFFEVTAGVSSVGAGFVTNQKSAEAATTIIIGAAINQNFLFFKKAQRLFLTIGLIGAGLTAGVGVWGVLICGSIYLTLPKILRKAKSRQIQEVFRSFFAILVASVLSSCASLPSSTN